MPKTTDPRFSDGLILDEKSSPQGEPGSSKADEDVWIQIMPDDLLKDAFNEASPNGHVAPSISTRGSFQDKAQLPDTVLSLPPTPAYLSSSSTTSASSSFDSMSNTDNGLNASTDKEDLWRKKYERDWWPLSLKDESFSDVRSLYMKEFDSCFKRTSFCSWLKERCSQDLFRSLDSEIGTQERLSEKKLIELGNYLLKFIRDAYGKKQGSDEQEDSIFSFRQLCLLLTNYVSFTDRELLYKTLVKLVIFPAPKGSAWRMLLGLPLEEKQFKTDLDQEVGTQLIFNFHLGHWALASRHKQGLGYFFADSSRQHNFKGRLNAITLSGRTMLHMAAMHSDERYLACLIDSGAEVGVKDTAGFTPLSYAVRNGRIASVRRLVMELAEKDIPLDTADKYLFTALHYAAYDGYAACLVVLVEALLRQKRGLEAKDKQQMTALHYAAQYGHLACVRELLAGGADPLVKNRQGQNPFDLAQTYKHQDCIDALDIAIRNRQILPYRAPRPIGPKLAIPRAGTSTTQIKKRECSQITLAADESHRPDDMLKQPRTLSATNASAFLGDTSVADLASRSQHEIDVCLPAAPSSKNQYLSEHTINALRGWAETLEPREEALLVALKKTTVTAEVLDIFLMRTVSPGKTIYVSAFLYLAFTVEGRKLIEQHQLFQFIDTRQLNATILRGPYQGASILLFLCMKKEWITHLVDLVGKIEKTTLNVLCPDFGNISAALLLSSHDAGLALLAQDNYRLTRWISQEALNRVARIQGTSTSIASVLAKTKKGRELLAVNQRSTQLSSSSHGLFCSRLGVEGVGVSTNTSAHSSQAVSTITLEP